METEGDGSKDNNRLTTKTGATFEYRTKYNATRMATIPPRKQFFEYPNHNIISFQTQSIILKLHTIADRGSVPKHNMDPLPPNLGSQHRKYCRIYYFHVVDDILARKR